MRTTPWLMPALALLVAAPAIAQPDIANVVGANELQNGSAFVIQGSGFGVKSTEAPIAWETFDQGSSGALLSTTGRWEVHSDNPDELKPQFSVENLRDGGGLNAKFTYPAAGSGMGSRDIILMRDLGIGWGEKVFLSLWVRSTYAGNADGTDPKQWKMFRLSDGPYNDDTYPDLYFDWNRTGFVMAYRDAVGNHITPCSEVSGSQIEYLAAPTPNVWHHLQVQAQVESAVGACDGGSRLWHDGQLVGQIWGAGMLAGSEDSGWDDLWIGEYVQENVNRYHVWYDDVYIDNSWARVEIGNAPSYGNCTRREVQIPSSWATNQISFVANQGAFAASEPLYLFVVDEDGTPSEGISVRFTSGGGVVDPPPGQPGKPVLQ